MELTLALDSDPCSAALTQVLLTPVLLWYFTLKKRPHPDYAFANIIFIVMRETEANEMVELSFAGKNSAALKTGLKFASFIPERGSVHGFVKL